MKSADQFIDAVIRNNPQDVADLLAAAGAVPHGQVMDVQSLKAALVNEASGRADGETFLYQVVESIPFDPEGDMANELYQMYEEGHSAEWLLGELSRPTSRAVANPGGIQLPGFVCKVDWVKTCLVLGCFFFGLGICYFFKKTFLTQS